MINHQMLHKNPQADLKLKYRKIFEWALIFTIFLLIVIFYSFKDFKSDVRLIKTIDSSIMIIKIPPTMQNELKPKPLQPAMPVAADDPDLPPELTISETEISFNEPLAKLEPLVPYDEVEPEVPFAALSEKPVPLHQVEPYYPELAQKAGIEGMVVVRVLIDTKGNVEKVEVVKSHPMLDEAAIAATKQFKFSIPRQRDRAVKVWMSIPFTFHLRR